MGRSDSLRSVKWIDFARTALPASTIAEYWFCPAKIQNMMRQGSVETPVTIAGSQIHEEEAQAILKQLGPLKKVKVESLLDAMLHSYRNLTAALRNRKILANSERNILFRCIVPETGFIGMPDVADCRNGDQPVLFETKTTGRLPREVWMDHRIQMGVYLMGLERLSFKPKFGIIEYLLRTDRSMRNRFEIRLDDELRETIQTTSKEVLNILNGKDPIPCKNPNKCLKCGYLDSCQWGIRK